LLLPHSKSSYLRFIQKQKDFFMKIKFCIASLLLFASTLATADAPFTVSADGQEVTDAKTGLIWRRCSEGMLAVGNICSGTPSTFTHEAALSRASSETAATGVTWRLPNVKELSSIADKSRSPAIDALAFPGTPGFWYWSSTPVAYSLFAWQVNFNDGFVFRNDRGSTNNYVRLVRAGQ
jgi:Protein of unknown function (DUF1566)